MISPQMTKKTRLLTFGIFAAIFLISYFIGTAYKMSSDELTSFLKDFQSSNAGIDSIGLFLHNASVALPMFIPAFGAAWGSFTGWQTGAGFEAMIASDSSLSGMSPLSLFLASPFGVLELGAYSLGMSRSFLLIWRIIKKDQLKKQIIPTLIEIGIAIVLLLIAGFIESYMMTPQHVSLSS